MHRMPVSCAGNHRVGKKMSGDPDGTAAAGDAPYPFEWMMTQSEMNDDHLGVSLNILRFHQMVRPNESFHTFLLFSLFNLIGCY